MLFSYEEVEAELLGSDNLPMREQLSNLRKWLSNTLDSTTEDGEPDIEKIYRNASFNMGEAGIKMGMIAFKAKLRLRKLTREYAKAKAKKLDELHRGVRALGWVPGQEAEGVMVEGDINVAELKEQVECQTDYVKFLEQQQENIRYYARNADSLARVHNFGTEIGKIIT